MVAARQHLLGLRLGVGFHVGYVVVPISLAVVFPSVLSLQDQGHGTTTGIHSMMVAVSSLDDVFSLAGFGIFSNLALGSEATSSKLSWQIGKALLSILLGLVFGWVADLFMGLLLPKDGEYSIIWRARWFFNMAVVFMAGFEKAKFGRASSLDVLVICRLKRWNKERSLLWLLVLDERER